MTVPLRRLRVQLVCTILIVAPVLFWPWARDAYHLTKLALITTLGVPAFGCWWLLGRPGWSVVPGWYRAAAGGFLGWSLLRSFGGMDGAAAAVRWLEWLAAFGTGCAALGFGAADRRRAITSLLAGALAAALIGAAQVVFGSQVLSPYAVDERSVTFTAERVFSTFGNPIFFAGFLALTLPPALGLAVERRRSGGSFARLAVWPGAVIVLQLAGLALASSRSAYLGIAAGLGLVALGVPALRRATLAVAAVVAGSVAVAGWWKPELLEHLLVAGDPVRLLMWRTSLAMIRSAPGAGVGLGRFTFAYPCAQQTVATAGEAGFGVNAVHAHDDFLEAAAELGLPGLLLFLAVFPGLILLPLAGLRGWGIRGGIAAIAVHALFNFPLHTQPVMTLIWVIAALGLRGERDPVAPGMPERSNRRSVLLFSCIASVIFSGIFLRPFVRSSYLQWALAYQDATKEPGRPPQFHDRFFDLSNLFFGDAARLLPDDSHARIGFQRGKMLFERGDLVGAQAEFEHDRDRFPCYPEGHGNLGVIYGVRAMHGEMNLLPRAEELILAALRLRPGGREAAADYNSLGNTRVLAGNLRGALEAYRKALECDPDSLEATVNVVQQLVKLGHRPEAQAVVDAALARRPADPELRSIAASLRRRR